MSLLPRQPSVPKSRVVACLLSAICAALATGGVAVVCIAKNGDTTTTLMGVLVFQAACWLGRPLMRYWIEDDR